MASSNKLKFHREEKQAYWLMILPAFLVYLFVMAFPTIISFALSFSNYGGGKMFGKGAASWGFAGLTYYQQLVTDPQFWISLKNNGYIILVSVFGQIPLGFLFAYLIFRKLVKAPGFWQGLLYVPAIISTIVIGSLWGALFSPYGPLADIVNSIYQAGFHNQLNELFGNATTFQPTDDTIHRLISLAGGQEVVSNAFIGTNFDEVKNYLSSGYAPNQLEVLKTDLTNLFAHKWSSAFMDQPDVAMLPVLFVVLWQWTGFYLIIFLANMQRIDTQVVEAAQIDGAKEGQILRHIILPSMSGVLVTTIILAISGSLRSFDLIYAMNGDKLATQVLSVYTYRTAFNATPNFPLANAISTVMVALSFMLIWITRLVEKKFGGKE